MSESRQPTLPESDQARAERLGTVGRNRRLSGIERVGSYDSTTVVGTRSGAGPNPPANRKT